VIALKKDGKGKKEKEKKEKRKEGKNSKLCFQLLDDARHDRNARHGRDLSIRPSVVQRKPLGANHRAPRIVSRTTKLELGSLINRF
jgi:hypothetical protein